MSLVPIERINLALDISDPIFDWSAPFTPYHAPAVMEAYHTAVDAMWNLAYYLGASLEDAYSLVLSTAGVNRHNVPTTSVKTMASIFGKETFSAPEPSIVSNTN